MERRFNFRKWIKYGLISSLILAAVGLVIYRRYKTDLAIWFFAPKNNGEFVVTQKRVVVQYNPGISPSRPWLDKNRNIAPLTTYHTYAASAIGGRETDYLIYLPPGYEEPANRDRRYPVVYWLHGYGSEPQYGSPFVDTLDAAIKSGDAPPIIAVLPNGLINSWYVDSVDGSQPMDSIIVGDLLPHIDRTFRTIADRNFRAVEGFSMGAWGAAHFAMKYPQHFCAATLLSGPMGAHKQFSQYSAVFRSDENAFYSEDPVTIARQNAAQLKDRVRFRIRVGERDHCIRLVSGFDKQLRDWGYRCDLRILPEVPHADDVIYEKIGPKDFQFYRELIDSK